MEKLQEMYHKAMSTWLNQMQVHLDILLNNKDSIEKNIELEQKKLSLIEEGIILTREQIALGDKDLDDHVKAHTEN